MVAMRVSPTDHVTARPVSVLSSASVTRAVKVVVLSTPTATLDGETITFDTGTSATLTVACPANPSITAVMMAEPGMSAVTRPVCETAATVALFVVHTTVRPEIGRAAAVVWRRDQRRHAGNKEIDDVRSDLHGRDSRRRGDHRHAGDAGLPFGACGNVDATRSHARDDALVGHGRDGGIRARPEDPMVAEHDAANAGHLGVECARAPDADIQRRRRDDHGFDGRWLVSVGDAACAGNQHGVDKRHPAPDQAHERTPGLRRSPEKQKAFHARVRHPEAHGERDSSPTRRRDCGRVPVERA